MKVVAFYLFGFFLLCSLWSCGERSASASTVSNEASLPLSKTKINGVSFVASRTVVSQKHINPVLSVHANYAAVMPFGFIRDLTNPEINFNSSRQWYGETRAGAGQYIDSLHKNGIKIMLKPQVWIWDGKFTGYLKMTSEEDWLKLEQSYRNFIIEYAELAAEKEVELFCIGTELEQFIVHRPAFWKAVIKEIRAIYTGKLTYAANWDEYKRVPFWESLDYIGVDAYFPVALSKTPTIDEASKGWKRWCEDLEAFSEVKQKQILFTEYGYRSVDFAGKEPWRSDREMNNVNLEAQNSTMQALFDSVWEKEWFAGGFLWKWFINHEEVGGTNNSQFTPQNKPVEQIIRKHYKNFN